MGDINPAEILAIAERADCLYPEVEVEAAIDKLAKEITIQLAGTNPILLCAMNGGLILTAKLAIRLKFPLNMDYIHATRYRNNTTGADVYWGKYPSIALSKRTVIVIDDVFDEGATLDNIVRYCKEHEAEKVFTAVLVDKMHDRKLTSMKCDFVGLKAEDRYLYGYGMDYKGYLRNVAGIYAIADCDI